MRFLFLGLFLFSLGCATTAVENYETGRALVEKANQLEEQSRLNMLEANSLRKKIRLLHVERRKAKDEDRKKAILNNIDTHTKQMESLHKQGSKSRTKAQKAKNKAVKKLKKGLEKNFATWIQTDRPLGLIGSAKQTAHNPKIRNIRRNTGVLTGKPREEQNAPADLDLNTFRLSRERKMVGHVEVHTDQGNPAGVPLNEIHQWRLIVSDLEGKPIDTNFKVIGHMPGHVHGLPTQPVVSKQLAPGVYLIEGMKFQMQGWWVLEFDNEEDRIRFDIAI